MFRLIIISLLAVSSWMSAQEASSLLNNSYLSVHDDSTGKPIKTSIQVPLIKIENKGGAVAVGDADYSLGGTWSWPRDLPHKKGSGGIAFSWPDSQKTSISALTHSSYIKQYLEDVLCLQLNDKDYKTFFENKFRDFISKTPMLVYADAGSVDMQYSSNQNGKQFFGLNLPVIAEAYKVIDKNAWTLEKFVKSSMAHEMGHQYLLHYYNGLGEKNFKYGPVFCVQEAFAIYSEILYAMKENSRVFYPSNPKTFREAMIHILDDYLNNNAPVETKYALNARYLYCLSLCLDYNNSSLGFNYNVLRDIDNWAKGNKKNIGIKGDGNKIPLGTYLFDYNKLQDPKEVQSFVDYIISRFSVKFYSSKSKDKDEVEALKKEQRPTLIECLKVIQNASTNIAAQEIFKMQK